MKRPFYNVTTSFGSTPAPASDPESLLRQALALHQGGRVDEAERLYRRILELQPRHFNALHLSGVIAGQRGDFGLAAELIGKAIGVYANDPLSNNNYANALCELGRTEDALAAYEKAITLNNDFIDAHFGRAMLLLRLGRLAESLAELDVIVGRVPEHAEAWFQRGNVLRQLQRYDDGCQAYEKARDLQPQNVDYRKNLGNIYRVLRRHEDALECYQEAVRLNPKDAEAYNNLGIAMRELERFDEAIAAYERAIELDPDYAPAHLHLAFCCLAKGDFARGFREHEWRWRVDGISDSERRFDKPLWLGDRPLAGKTILLHAEQGLGDTIQFCRYASEVKRQGARVILEVQRPLRELLAGLDGVDVIHAKGDPLPAFDLHCPLLSLPLACGTGIATIPARSAYLGADQTLVEKWRSELGPATRPRIAFAWCGNPAKANDRNRSMSFATVHELCDPAFEWFSVQMEMPDADREFLGTCTDVRHIPAGFAETAALFEAMDLIVTVDTSMAHLAGALGRPVWIMLSFDADWRWLAGRDDTPWYPSARLFRQDRAEGWPGLVRDMRAAIRRQFAVTT
jgi:tetratricopeptide (TPR) repeat protein